MAEEGDVQAPIDAQHLWIIDPLDGTSNFANTFPHFCISIAYAEKGVVQGAVVFDPCRKELFSAINGRGAFMNDRKITVTQKNDITHAIVAMGFYYDRGELLDRTLESIRRLFKNNIRDIRRTGSAALDLAWTACGRMDGYFEYDLSVWDFAAGILLVKEAGGVCTDRFGEPGTLKGKGIIASNKPLHETLLRLLKFER